MKIVHVIPALTKGGAERVVVDLANRAVKDGCEVTILIGVNAPEVVLPAPISKKVVRRVIAPRAHSPRVAYAQLAPWIVRNRRWLLDQDVIHCHLSMGSVFGGLFQLVRGKRRRPTIVETYHAVGMEIPARDRAVHAALMKSRDAVAFVADDPFWRGYREKYSNRLLRVIPNGIEPARPASRSKSDSFRKIVGVPADARLVGSIGRLVHERRPDLLLEAFAALSNDYAGEVHLLLGGEGPERAKLAGRARDLGLSERVHLPGIVLDPPSVLGLIDLYLTVNVGPITGIAAMEAAFSGIPVIAAQLVPGYVPAATDWIWSTPDPSLLGLKAGELLEDREARISIGREQQAHVRAHHSVEAMAKAYYRLYEEALARREMDRGS